MRTVVSENEVSAKIETAASEFPRIQEQFEALEWTLAHNPNIGIPLRDGYYVYRQGQVLAKSPELTVLYSFTADEVHVLSVRILTE